MLPSSNLPPSCSYPGFLLFRSETYLFEGVIDQNQSRQLGWAWCRSTQCPRALGLCERTPGCGAHAAQRPLKAVSHWAYDGRGASWGTFWDPSSTCLAQNRMSGHPKAFLAVQQFACFKAFKIRKEFGTHSWTAEPKHTLPQRSCISRPWRQHHPIP